jgi:hypothetical protein
VDRLRRDANRSREARDGLGLAGNVRLERWALAARGWLWLDAIDRAQRLAEHPRLQ